MTRPVKARSVFYSPLILYTLAAAFIFTLGFFIVFGRAAHFAKTWQYVMPDNDSVYYWSVARGRTTTPRSDGNPLYYEEQGARNIIPFTTAEGVGLLSKYTGIPLSWFVPAWQILMPLFVWYVLVVCSWKLWGCPLDLSASGVMLLLLSVLYSPFPLTLMRFSRPLDGIAPLFLWITLIFKGDPRNKWHRGAIVFTSALTLWLQPFNAALGLWVTALEYLHSLSRREGFLKAQLHLCALGSSFFSGLLFLGYALCGNNVVSEMLKRHTYPKPTLFHIAMTVLMFFVVTALVLFFHGRFRKKVSSLDRFVIEWALFGVIVYLASRMILAARECTIHMLYFIYIVVFSLAGWIHEKLQALKEAGYFRQFSNILALAVAAFLLVTAITRKNLVFVRNHEYFVYLTQYFIVLLLGLWLFERFDFVKRIVRRKVIIWPVILLIAVAGYWGFQATGYTRNFPYAGGFQWLNQHARKNDVVLTASPDPMIGQYLFFKTGLKNYYYLFSCPAVTPAREFRRYFVAGLLAGVLDKTPYLPNLSISQKLHALKLDYIIVEKGNPFFGVVAAQLGGFLRLAYQDQRCLIWKVM